MVKSFKEKIINAWGSFVVWFNKKFPQKFDFRYDKLTKEFLTVPMDEIESWDADYAKRLEEAEEGAVA